MMVFLYKILGKGGELGQTWESFYNTYKKQENTENQHLNNKLDDFDEQFEEVWVGPNKKYCGCFGSDEVNFLFGKADAEKQKIFDSIRSNMCVFFKYYSGKGNQKDVVYPLTNMKNGTYRLFWQKLVLELIPAIIQKYNEYQKNANSQK